MVKSFNDIIPPHHTLYVAKAIGTESIDSFPTLNKVSSAIELYAGTFLLNRKGQQPRRLLYLAHDHVGPTMSLLCIGHAAIIKGGTNHFR